jgi:hypothetical protein
MLRGLDRKAEALTFLDLELLELRLDGFEGHWIEISGLIVRGAH